jgi:hypothetical protein
VSFCTPSAESVPTHLHADLAVHPYRALPQLPPVRQVLANNGITNSLSTWSFVCGDRWAGWGADAANVACRQSGYSAGGEPLSIWRGGALPQLLPVSLSCSGAENTLSECDVTAPSGAIDAWLYGSGAAAAGDAVATTCQSLAGVRCRGDLTRAATVALRAAAAPPPSGTTVAAAAGATRTTGAVFVARLEASINNGPYGAVCLDDGFDAAAATVACRSLGLSGAAAAVYDSGAAVGAQCDAGAAMFDNIVDAQGSFLGSLSSVRCSGGESSLGDCVSWRADLPSSMIPCRAAAWVVCQR